MKRFTLHSALFIFGLAGLMASCSSGDNEPDDKPTPIEEPKPTPEPIVIKERQDIPLNSFQKEGITLQNDFAFRLFNADNRNNSSNSLISPLSLTLCLSMAANGATEEVKDEIVANLLPSGGSIDELNALNKYLVESLKDVDNSAILSLANSAWTDKNFSFLSPFEHNIEDFYNAECNSLDFSSKSAQATINEWVKNTTNGLIPELIFSPGSTALVLINTLYFNGAWLDPFEEEFTKKGFFNNENGTKSEVDFMNKNTYFNCAINSDYSVLQLPYGNKAFNYYALMPAEGKELTLTAEKWGEIKKEIQTDNIIVCMPKFEIKYEVESLVNKLQNAGISRLFTTKSALKNTITPTPADNYVEMIHKTVFKVNEIGAEGAGLSALLWCTSPGPEYEPAPTPKIILDRPFMFIVEEQSTNAILFMGAVRSL